MDISTTEFIAIHANDDPNKLRLKYHGDNDAMRAILQIECRRRASSKLSATLRCKQFQFPSSLAAEQCTSDELAEFHASLIPTGTNVIDMTCGLGIDTFHFARNGCTVTSIELNPEYAECARANAAVLGLPSVNIINADSKEWLINNPLVKADIIFIDPARRGTSGQRLFSLEDCSPNVIELIPLLKNRCSRIIIKASPMLDVSATTKVLDPYIQDLYITGNKRECKELVAILDFRKRDERKVCIHTVIGNRVIFSFDMDSESTSPIRESLPKVGDILHEPWPAIVKSGAFKLLASRYDLSPIARDTHLYHSAKANEQFPGNLYRIISINPYNKSGIKLTSSMASGKAQVACKNFGITPEHLAAKLRIKNSDNELRIWGVKDHLCNRILISATRMR